MKLRLELSVELTFKMPAAAPGRWDSPRERAGVSPGAGAEMQKKTLRLTLSREENAADAGGISKEGKEGRREEQRGESAWRRGAPLLCLSRAMPADLRLPCSIPCQA